MTATSDLIIRDVHIAERSGEACSVLVRDGRIAQVAPWPGGVPEAKASEYEAGSQVLDGRGAWLMPGLIDAHCHLCYDYPRRVRDPRDAVIGAVAAANAAAKVASGVTTVRDLGAMAHRNIKLKHAVAGHRTLGPNLITAGDIICAVGGHMNHYARQVAGEDDIRAAVREQSAAGAEWIKLMVSGGVALAGERWDQVQLSEAEIAAAVDEARGLGLKVAAHAHPRTAIIAAAKNGCDTVEHATELDDEAIAVLLEHRCAVIPTLAVYHRIISDDGIPPDIQQQTKEIWDLKVSLLRRAYEAGVRIGVGTDSGSSLPAAEINAELRLLAREVGMPNSEVIQAATSGNAEILGLPQLTGRVEVGAPADLVLAEGSPYEDLTALSRITAVIQSGSVFSEDLMSLTK